MSERSIGNVVPSIVGICRVPGEVTLPLHPKLSCLNIVWIVAMQGTIKFNVDGSLFENEVEIASGTFSGITREESCFTLGNISQFTSLFL